jgi:hypothetical protein
MNKFAPSLHIAYIPTKYARELGTPFNGIRDDDATVSVELVRTHSLRNAENDYPHLGNDTCTVSVIGIGQWDASWAESHPTPVATYEREIRHTVQTIHVAFPQSQILLWNIHDNMLRTMSYATCPATEWRLPPLIDQYNVALQRIVADIAATAPTFPIKYLDTSFIVRPQWDSAKDTSHYVNAVGYTEALYIASVIAGILPRFSVT